MPAASDTKPPGEIMTVLLDAASEPREHEKDADGYRALLVAIFIPRYLRHFRLYVVPVLVGSVLGVMMTSLYFLQPQRLISTVIFVWVAGMVAGAFLILVPRSERRRERHRQHHGGRGQLRLDAGLTHPHLGNRPF